MSRSELIERLIDDYGYEMEELQDKPTEYLDTMYRFWTEEADYE